MEPAAGPPVAPLAGAAALQPGHVWVSRSRPHRGAAPPPPTPAALRPQVPASATFAPGVKLGKLWAPLRQPGSDALPETLLPVVWRAGSVDAGGDEAQCPAVDGCE